MIIAGLTGNLGSGKSTVLSMFRDCGAAVIDTDQIAHALLEPKGKCFRAISQKFPQAVDSGKIQRPLLAAIVFDHPRKLAMLEGIVHPAVRREVLKQLTEIRRKGRKRMAVVDVPLLFEAKFDDLFDIVIVVRANRALQLSRLRQSRGMSARQVTQRLKRQVPQAEKIKRADFVIDNRMTKAKTRTQVKRLWDGLVVNR